MWYGYFWLDLFSVYPEVVEAGAVFRLSPRCSCNTSGVCNDVLISVSDSVLRTFFFMPLIISFFLRGSVIVIYVDSPFRLPFTASVGVSEAPAHIGHALLCDREFTHSRVNLLRFSSLALPFHFLFFELQNFSLPHVSSWWDLFLLFSLSQVF